MRIDWLGTGATFAAAFLAGLAVPARGMGKPVIISSHPGNIFVSGRPVEFSVEKAGPGARYELVDYYGETVESGRATERIRLGRLSPGWYELGVTDGKEEAKVSLGAAMDVKRASGKGRGRVCTDLASAWLVRDEGNRRNLAKIISLAGFTRVRERLSWAQVEKERGKIEWGRYSGTAESLAKEGVKICQVWHDSPDWSRPDSPDVSCPDDLREVYRFAREAAKRFRLEIDAWEIWNEPDIFFWKGNADRFSAFQKAAYLGIKDGNPRARVLQASLCRGVSPFARNLYESQAYFDVFNWHVYADPSSYPRSLAEYRSLHAKFGLGIRESWMTEAGIRLPADGNLPGGPLSAKNMEAQCRFVPRSVVMSLAAGNEKHFFFIAPAFTERGVQFGSLRPDLTPNPAFLALSAAANLIGDSEYLGAYREAREGVEAHLFRTPKGNVMAAWSEEETVLEIPTEKKAVSIAGVFGATRELEVSDGAARVPVGPEAVYAVGIGKRVASKVSGPPPRPARRETAAYSRIVLSGWPDLPEDKEGNGYVLGDGSRALDAPVDFAVEVYNFDGRREASGEVVLDLPAGWDARESVRKVSVGPMGRKVLEFTIKPVVAGPTRARVTVHADFGKRKVSPSVSFLKPAESALGAVKTKPLPWSEVSGWKVEEGYRERVKLEQPATGRLRMDAGLAGDKWAEVIMPLDPPVDFSGYDGISCELTSLTGGGEEYVFLVVIGAGGEGNMTGKQVSTTASRYVFLFQDMGLEPEEAAEKLARAGAVKLGVWSEDEKMSFTAGNFELVKLGVKK